MSEQYAAGTIGWLDLTVADAAKVRQFYENVIGWSSSGVDMGGYEDFTMLASDGETPVAGVCHSRGANADIPPYWIPYFIVEDLDQGIQSVNSGGGAIVSGPRTAGSTGRYCIIRDPAGAYAALFQSLIPPVE